MLVNNMKKYFFAFVYFSFAIILFIFASFDKKTLDIVNHDSYLIIQYELIWILLSLYFFALSLITFCLKYFNILQSKVWLHLHIWSSLIIFLGIIFTFNQSIKETTPKRYYDYSVYEDFNNSSTTIYFNELVTVLVILFVFVQSFFIISILVGFIQQRKHGKSNN